MLVACSHAAPDPSNAKPTSTSSYDPTVYRIDDLGKPGQPTLTKAQAVWVTRILRTPYYQHRHAQLRYLDDDFNSDPPLGVFLQIGDGGVEIVDHVGTNEPCNGAYNPREHDFVANTPGCEDEALPSPVKQP